MKTVPIAVVLAAAFTITSAHAQKYKAEVPESILTPDTVETKRLGTLKFFNGLPDDETVRKVYDNLDFARGVEAFLAGVPAASVYATCDGFDKAGITPNEVIGITVWFSPKKRPPARRQLGADLVRQGLEFDHSPLRPAGAVVSTRLGSRGISNWVQ